MEKKEEEDFLFLVVMISDSLICGGDTVMQKQMFIFLHN